MARPSPPQAPPLALTKRQARPVRSRRPPPGGWPHRLASTQASQPCLAGGGRSAVSAPAGPDPSGLCPDRRTPCGLPGAAARLVVRHATRRSIEKPSERCQASIGLELLVQPLIVRA